MVMNYPLWALEAELRSSRTTGSTHLSYFFYIYFFLKKGSDSNPSLPGYVFIAFLIYVARMPFNSCLSLHSVGIIDHELALSL